MARRDGLDRTIRRRRVVAALVFVVVIAAVAGVSLAAVRHHTTRSAPTTTVTLPPPPKQFHVVFPEGFTREQMGLRVKAVARIADREHHGRVRLNETAYLFGARSAVVPCFGKARRTKLEGFLFPATYPFFKATTSRALVLEQIQTFCRRWRQVNLAYARSKNLTPYDVLTIASMVEREASVPSERRLVAAVIYNRLRNRMQLGIDATLRYGLHIPPTKSISESQLASSNPYNTRRFYGLPPTPIANPGLAAIQAAAHPAHVDYLYYVRKPDHKHHFFTASASAFDAYLAAHGYK
jgi:peptidoglycan lytic transglycosylase G